MRCWNLCLSQYASRSQGFLFLHSSWREHFPVILLITELGNICLLSRTVPLMYTKCETKCRNVVQNYEYCFINAKIPFLCYFAFSLYYLILFQTSRNSSLLFFFVFFCSFFFFFWFLIT